MTRELFESMATHPAITPVFDLLKLVEPVDEFSRALCLVRDCFSETDTLRILSRRQLQSLMQRRLDLMTSFETAVVQAARDTGATPANFVQAVKVLPDEVYRAMRDSFARQVDELMGRAL